eukprot:g10314.t1
MYRLPTLLTDVQTKRLLLAKVLVPEELAFLAAIEEQVERERFLVHRRQASGFWSERGPGPWGVGGPVLSIEGKVPKVAKRRTRGGAAAQMKMSAYVRLLAHRRNMISLSRGLSAQLFASREPGDRRLCSGQTAVGACLFRPALRSGSLINPTRATAAPQVQIGPNTSQHPRASTAQSAPAVKSAGPLAATSSNSKTNGGAALATPTAHPTSMKPWGQAAPPHQAHYQPPHGAAEITAALREAGLASSSADEVFEKQIEGYCAQTQFKVQHFQIDHYAPADIPVLVNRQFMHQHSRHFARAAIDVRVLFSPGEMLHTNPQAMLHTNLLPNTVFDRASSSGSSAENGGAGAAAQDKVVSIRSARFRLVPLWVNLELSSFFRLYEHAGLGAFVHHVQARLAHVARKKLEIISGGTDEGASGGGRNAGKVAAPALGAVVGTKMIKNTVEDEGGANVGVVRRLLAALVQQARDVGQRDEPPAAVEAEDLSAEALDEKISVKNSDTVANKNKLHRLDAQEVSRLQRLVEELAELLSYCHPQRTQTASPLALQLERQAWERDLDVGENADYRKLAVLVYLPLDMPNIELLIPQQKIRNASAAPLSETATAFASSYLLTAAKGVYNGGSWLFRGPFDHLIVARSKELDRLTVARAAFVQKHVREVDAEIARCTLTNLGGVIHPSEHVGGTGAQGGRSSGTSTALPEMSTRTSTSSTPIYLPYRVRLRNDPALRLQRRFRRQKIFFRVWEFCSGLDWWVVPLQHGLSEGFYRAMTEVSGNILISIRTDARCRQKANGILEGFVFGLHGLVTDSLFTPTLRLIGWTREALHDYGRTVAVFSNAARNGFFTPLMHLVAAIAEGLASALLQEEAQFALFEPQRNLLEVAGEQ